MQYPMNMEMKGRLCVVLGGGHVSCRKVGTLCRAGAEVLVIAPEVLPELEEMAWAGAIRWRKAPYEPGCLRGAFLVICATDDPEVNRRAAGEATGAGILVNAPAQPDLSDFSVPASIRRGNLLVTVSTGNQSPAFSRVLREQLEEFFPPVFGQWLERLHCIRGEARGVLGSSREREEFWRNAMSGRMLELVKAGRLDQAEVELRHAIDGDRTEP